MRYNRCLKFLLAAIFLLALLPVPARAAGSAVAIFPFQEVGEGRQGVNLQLSGELAVRLSEIGTEVIFPETVISFMASNRIRTLGSLEKRQVNQVRRDLGASFVLLGTVLERDKHRVPSIGLMLSLIRTSDARTIWTYAGSFSAARERNLLAIGDAEVSDDLQPFLFKEIEQLWPLQTIRNEQLVSSVVIDAVELTPRAVQPGGEVTCRVRLFESWPADNVPKIFFKVDNQLYPADPGNADKNFAGSWLASETNGIYTVSLIMDWPNYQRTETVLLGNYTVDGTLPMFELDLRGTATIDGRPVFLQGLRILTRKIVQEPVKRWHLTIFSVGRNETSATLNGEGELPESFYWNGRVDLSPEGLYRVTVEAWDQAENLAQVTGEAVLISQAAQMTLDLENKKDEIIVNLKDAGRVPLSYWRLEMWTKEGKILTQTEGDQLPVKFELEVSEAEQSKLDGFLFYSDIMGRETRRRVRDLLPKLEEKNEKVKSKDETKGISESWVDDF